MEQGTQEWFNARKGKITGSRVGAILGHSKFATRDDVMREMVREHYGKEKEFKGNVATDYGNRMESFARDAYINATGKQVDEVGFIDEGIYGVSPDGVVIEDFALVEGVEIKCPYNRLITVLPEQPSYYDQICLSLVVTHANKWAYFCYVSENEYHLEYVDKYEAIKWFDENRDDLESFYNEYLEYTEDENKAEKYLKDKKEYKDLSKLEEVYKQAKKNVEDAESNMKRIKDLIIKEANGNNR